MSNVVNHKKIGKMFSNEERQIKLSWVGATDGVAIGTYTLADVETDILVTDATVHVPVAVTAVGAPAFTCGSSTGDVDAFMEAATGVKANLTLNSTFKFANGQKLRIASGEKINLAIADAVATTGSVDVYLTVRDI